MTVARDAVLESATFTTVTPFTFVFTPVGTPRAIVLAIAQTGSVTDTIDGTVSYGGVAMTRLPTVGFAVDSSGEVGSVFFYFLGSGIPTGAQTVSISHTGAATTKWAICASATAAADTEVGASGRLQGNQANPQIALDTGAASSLRFSILFHGAQLLSDLTVLSGMEANATATSIDFGNTLGVFGQQTTAATGSFTIGYTAADDDVAMIAVAIQEVSGVATVDPYPYIGGGYYPHQG